MTTITQLITRTLELDEAATPGPWHVCGGSECTVLVSESPGETTEVDFDLMDEYRTAAPLLAKECQRLQKELDEASEELLQCMTVRVSRDDL